MLSLPPSLCCSIKKPKRNSKKTKDNENNSMQKHLSVQHHYGTTHRAKPTINPLSIAKNKASRYSFSSATALGNPWPIGAAAFHDSTISVDRPVWSLSPLSPALPESPPPICSDCSSPPRSSATIFYSLAPTVLSTSRFQVFLRETGFSFHE